MRRYGQWYQKPPGSILAGLEQKALSHLLSPLQPGTILEVGCGSGYFSDWLQAIGHRAVGLDRSLMMLKEAKARFPALPLLQGEAEHLPFRDHSFDLVAFIISLEFVNDPAAALREAARVARRGMLLGTLNPWSPYLLSRLLRHRSPYYGGRYYSRRRLDGLMRSILDRPYRLLWTSALLSPRWGKAPIRFPGSGFQALRVDFLDAAGAEGRRGSEPGLG